jgi:hypothetical protein
LLSVAKGQESAHFYQRRRIVPRKEKPAVESKTGAEDVPAGSSGLVKRVGGPPKAEGRRSGPSMTDFASLDNFQPVVNT